MIEPWLYYSLLTGIPALLLIIALLLSRSSNTDFKSLVEKLSYEEKKDLEIQLKIHRILSTLDSNKIRGDYKRIAQAIYDGYEENDKRLKGFMREVKSSYKH